MRLGRTALAYIAGVAATFLAAAIFYTQQVLSRQADLGVAYSVGQKAEALLLNMQGLAPLYGLVLSAALLIGFAVAAGVKRLIKPLAPVAYPVAGAAAVIAAVVLIETTAAPGGAGALAGARGAGLLLQGVAGALGGLVFAWLRPKRA